MPGVSGFCDAWAEPKQEEAIQRNGRGGAQGKSFTAGNEKSKSLVSRMHKCFQVQLARDQLSGYMLSDCKIAVQFLCISLCSNVWQHLTTVSPWSEGNSTSMRRVS